MSLLELPRPLRHRGLLLAILLCMAELVVLGLLYQEDIFDFACRDAMSGYLCETLRRSMPRGIGMLAAFVLYGLANFAALEKLLDQGAAPGPGLRLNLIGFLMILVPWSFVQGSQDPLLVNLALTCWAAGALLTIWGLAELIAPVAAWSRFVRSHAFGLLAVLTAGALLPEVARLVTPIWRIEFITDVTFDMVVRTMELMGYAVTSDPATKVIGAGNFYVSVHHPCSGIEGFVLITAFLTIYLALFRRELRFPTVLLLYPIGIAASWVFNVLRISILLSIGVEGNPELAIGAFHSHAGWLAFTLLSLGLILASRALPVFARRPEGHERAPALPPFFHDPSVARILPFAVFMFSALLASTFSENPALLYPWRALAMAVSLALFLPALRQLPWRLDPLSVAVGLGIGAMWILTAPAAEGDGIRAELAGIALTIWVITRILGTALFVPIIEELLFRDYWFSKIAPKGGALPMTIAVLTSAAAFAALHDRWIEAAIAGVLFGLLVWRSRNVTDAIVSHATANLSIAIWALAFGAWHIL